MEAQDVKRYQSWVMRMGYLSQDRTDLQRVVRELAKGMVSPTSRHLTMLKRAARFLRFAPRVVQRFRYQSHLKVIETFVDSDHGGCIRSRKSTAGVVIMLASSLLRSLCRGQAVVALSSAEKVAQM